MLPASWGEKAKMPGDQLEEQDTYKKSILSCFSLFQCLSPFNLDGDRFTEVKSVAMLSMPEALSLFDCPFHLF